MVVEIEFCNKTNKPVQVLEHDGTLLILPPKGTAFCEIFDWKTSYARWSKVTFKDGKIDFAENAGYVWPWPGRLMLEVVNVDGTRIESFPVAGQYHHCYKGIPKFIPISVNDLTWAFYAKVELVWVESKKLEGDFYVKHRELKWVKTPRSKKEIKDLQKQLLLEATEKAKAEMERLSPKAENGEEA